MNPLTPNVYDAILACMEQIKEVEYKPNIVLMHPIYFRYLKVNKVIYLVKAQVKRNKLLRHKRR